ERVAVRRDGYKLIREIDGAGAEALYRLSDDPGERKDRATGDPDRVRTLGADLDDHLAELRAEGLLDFGLEREAMPDALREQLRVLGYIE
ncbi:MAG: sulfatase, partial [Deltaproteobacteria bacterium]|nr:sulfatase [Deltaproteobacteria bacterium]